MKSSVLLYRSLLLAGLLSALPVLAADKPTSATSPDLTPAERAKYARDINPNGSGSSGTTAAPDKPAPFTLEIRNGSIIEDGKPTVPATVGNILEYVKRHNAPFNLALGPGVANVTVGDMIMHLYGPDSAYAPAAESPSYTRTIFEEQSLCDAIIAATVPPMKKDGVDNGYALLLDSPNLKVQVFNLSNYLNPDGGAEPADKEAQAAVQEKLAALREIILNTLSNLNPNASSAPTVKFQFHEGANLLVVTGDDQAIDVTKKVVDALTQPVAYAGRPGGSPSAKANPKSSSSYSWTMPQGPDHPKVAGQGNYTINWTPQLSPEELKRSQDMLNLMMAMSKKVNLPAGMDATEPDAFFSQNGQPPSPEEIKQAQELLKALMQSIKATGTPPTAPAPVVKSANP